jgi:Cu2+-exporting ATPase
MGLEAGQVRLGNRAWCGVGDGEAGDGSELWLAAPERAPVRFSFSDAPRADARAVVDALKRRGLAVELLSGDRAEAVARVAGAVGIDRFRAASRPADKVARLEELARAGHKVLMVGDGLNDAPALAAAHVSISPARAADISRTAADFVVQGERLAPVLEALAVARASRSLVLTPLIAAAAMSASSLVVTMNALRLRLRRGLAP